MVCIIHGVKRDVAKLTGHCEPAITPNLEYTVILRLQPYWRSWGGHVTASPRRESLVRDSSDRPIKLGDVDGEGFVIGVCSVTQNTECNLLAQQQ